MKFTWIIFKNIPITKSYPWFLGKIKERTIGEWYEKQIFYF
jgi:hypothetical protein